jgi:hypothetical protein
MRGIYWPAKQQQILMKDYSEKLLIAVLYPIWECYKKECDLVASSYTRYNCTFQSYHRDQRAQKISYHDVTRE